MRLTSLVASLLATFACRNEYTDFASADKPIFDFRRARIVPVAPGFAGEAAAVKLENLSLATAVDTDPAAAADFADGVGGTTSITTSDTTLGFDHAAVRQTADFIARTNNSSNSGASGSSDIRGIGNSWSSWTGSGAGAFGRQNPVTSTFVDPKLPSLQSMQPPLVTSRLNANYSSSSGGNNGSNAPSPLAQVAAALSSSGYVSFAGSESSLPFSSSSSPSSSFTIDWSALGLGHSFAPKSNSDASSISASAVSSAATGASGKLFKRRAGGMAGGTGAGGSGSAMTQLQKGLVIKEVQREGASDDEDDGDDGAAGGHDRDRAAQGAAGGDSSPYVLAADTIGGGDDIDVDADADAEGIRAGRTRGSSSRGCTPTGLVPSSHVSPIQTASGTIGGSSSSGDYRSRPARRSRVASDYGAERPSIAASSSSSGRSDAGDDDVARGDAGRPIEFAQGSDAATAAANLVGSAFTKSNASGGPSCCDMGFAEQFVRMRDTNNTASNAASAASGGAADAVPTAALPSPTSNAAAAASASQARLSTLVVPPQPQYQQQHLSYAGQPPAPPSSSAASSSRLQSTSSFVAPVIAPVQPRDYGVITNPGAALAHNSYGIGASVYAPFLMSSNSGSANVDGASSTVSAQSNFASMPNQQQQHQQRIQTTASGAQWSHHSHHHHHQHAHGGNSGAGHQSHHSHHQQQHPPGVFVPVHLPPVQVPAPASIGTGAGAVGPGGAGVGEARSARAEPSAAAAAAVLSAPRSALEEEALDDDRDEIMSIRSHHSHHSSASSAAWALGIATPAPFKPSGDRTEQNGQYHHDNDNVSVLSLGFGLSGMGGAGLGNANGGADDDDEGPMSSGMRARGGAGKGLALYAGHGAGATSSGSNSASTVATGIELNAAVAPVHAAAIPAATTGVARLGGQVVGPPASTLQHQSAPVYLQQQQQRPSVSSTSVPNDANSTATSSSTAAGTLSTSSPWLQSHPSRISLIPYSRPRPHGTTTGDSDDEDSGAYGASGGRPTSIYASNGAASSAVARGYSRRTESSPAAMALLSSIQAGGKAAFLRLSEDQRRLLKLERAKLNKRKVRAIERAYEAGLVIQYHVLDQLAGALRRVMGAYSLSAKSATGGASSPSSVVAAPSSSASGANHIIDSLVAIAERLAVTDQANARAMALMSGAGADGGSLSHAPSHDVMDVIDPTVGNGSGGKQRLTHAQRAQVMASLVRALMGIVADHHLHADGASGAVATSAGSGSASIAGTSGALLPSAANGSVTSIVGRLFDTAVGLKPGDVSPSSVILLGLNHSNAASGADGAAGAGGSTRRGRSTGPPAPTRTSTRTSSRIRGGEGITGGGVGGGSATARGRDASVTRRGTNAATQGDYADGEGGSSSPFLPLPPALLPPTASSSAAATGTSSLSSSKPLTLTDLGHKESGNNASAAGMAAAAALAVSGNSAAGNAMDSGSGGDAGTPTPAAAVVDPLVDLQSILRVHGDQRDRLPGLFHRSSLDDALSIRSSDVPRLAVLSLHYFAREVKSITADVDAATLLLAASTVPAGPMQRPISAASGIGGSSSAAGSVNRPAASAGGSGGGGDLRSLSSELSSILQLSPSQRARIGTEVGTQSLFTHRGWVRRARASLDCCARVVATIGRTEEPEAAAAAASPDVTPATAAAGDGTTPNSAAAAVDDADGDDYETDINGGGASSSSTMHGGGASSESAVIQANNGLLSQLTTLAPAQRERFVAWLASQPLVTSLGPGPVPPSSLPHNTPVHNASVPGVAGMNGILKAAERHCRPGLVLDMGGHVLASGSVAPAPMAAGVDLDIDIDAIVGSHLLSGVEQRLVRETSMQQQSATHNSSSSSGSSKLSGGASGKTGLYGGQASATQAASHLPSGGGSGLIGQQAGWNLVAPGGSGSASGGGFGGAPAAVAPQQRRKSHAAMAAF